MKKLRYHTNNYLLLALLAAVVFIQSGCKKDASASKGTPVITAIRNYVPSPGDSLLSRAGTGQWIVISGKNLKGALKINFDGIAGSFNDAWSSDTSAIALIPAVIAFPLVPSKQLNTIQYITNHGETTFSFPIVALAPLISSISNESANSGETVIINGFNFFFVQSLTYAGVPVTSYTPSTDGTTISLVVPAGVTQTGGVVSITTKSGSVSTVYTVHDFVTGMLCNFDDINNYSYGATVKNDPALFPGAVGYYAEMSTTAPLSSYDYNQYTNGRSINLKAVQWVPQANLSDPITSYALKFEINVNKPWSGGTLMIRRDEGTWLFLARYEPWKAAPKSTFISNGWTTVVIPLINFKSKGSQGEGTGNSAPDLTTLINTTGKRPMIFMLINDQSTAGVTPIDIAVDNIRIVKIAK